MEQPKYVIKRNPKGGIDLLIKASVKRLDWGYDIDTSKPYSLIYADKEWGEMWDHMSNQGIFNTNEVFDESEKNELIEEAFYEPPK